MDLNTFGKVISEVAQYARRATGAVLVELFNDSGAISSANPLSVAVEGGVTQTGLSVATISTATTTTVKSGAGTLGTIHVTGGTAGTIVVYDNTAGSGTKILDVASTDNAEFVLNVAFATGLTIVTSAATKLTVTYL